MIELFNDSKSYGPTHVLRDVNLTVKDGEFISIRGKSVVGKTTMLKIIGMLEQPEKGEVKLFGNFHQHAEQTLNINIIEINAKL